MKLNPIIAGAAAVPAGFMPGHGMRANRCGDA